MVTSTGGLSCNCALDLALLDPELTVGLPPYTTATTGMDALAHAVEAYTNKTYNTRLENDLCFVVDPLDGTKEFIKQEQTSVSADKNLHLILKFVGFVV